MQQGQYRLIYKSPLWLLILVGILLTSCGTNSAGTWPGISASGDRVYVAYNTNVTAVDMTEQEEVWSYAGEGNVQFYAPPSIEDGMVILGDYGSSGGLFSTGLTVSVYALEDQDRGEPNVLWIAGDSISGRVFARPLPIGDKVILGTSDNQVVALNIEDGSLIWEFPTGNQVWSQPAIKDDMVYVTSVDRRVYALDLNTGEKLWEATLTGANGGSPVVGDQYVYVGSFDGKLHAYDAETGAEAWTATAKDWIWGAPAYSNGNVFYTDLDGTVYAIDGQTGDALWEQTVDGAIQANIVIQDDVLYIASGDSVELENARGYVTALSSEDGTVLWAEQMDAPIHSTPVISIDSLVVVVIDAETQLPKLIEIDLENGNETWSVILGQEE